MRKLFLVRVKRRRLLIIDCGFLRVGWDVGLEMSRFKVFELLSLYIKWIFLYDGLYCYSILVLLFGFYFYILYI